MLLLSGTVLWSSSHLLWTPLCLVLCRRVFPILPALIMECLVKTFFIFNSRQNFSYAEAFPVSHAVCPAVSPERSSVQHQCGRSIKPAYIEKVFNLCLFKTV